MSDPQFRVETSSKTKVLHLIKYCWSGIFPLFTRYLWQNLREPWVYYQIAQTSIQPPPLVCSFEYFVAKQFTFLCIFNIWLFPHFGNNVPLVPVRKVTNCRYAANLDFVDSSWKRRRGALFFCWRRRGTVGAAWKELNEIFGNLDPRPKLWHLKGGGRVFCHRGRSHHLETTTFLLEGKHHLLHGLHIQFSLDCSYWRGWVCKFKFCPFVRHHFNIPNLGPSNHPRFWDDWRIMSEPTYYTLERGWHQRWHDQDKYEDKDKMLKRSITCHIVEKQGVQGY